MKSATYHIDDDGYDCLYDDVVDEIINTGIKKYVTEHQENMAPVQMLALTDILYESEFGKINDDEVVQQIMGDDRFDPALENLSGVEPYLETFLSIIDKLVDDDEDAVLAELDKLIESHPDSPDLAVLHINLLRDLNRIADVDRLTQYWYERAGDLYTIRLLYAQWLTEQERYDEVLDFFENHSGLDAITTDDVKFTDVMVAEFCACYVMAWLAKNRIDQAEPYYRILIELDNKTPIIDSALMTMVDWKSNAVGGKYRTNYR